ncbi:glucose 1-dehydrogenase 3 [Papilio machaon]|uniref:glucose 1-dehydrogenase 3 n=1 Tax=Papilio machaon TaxID=76193 RepID=UPI001E665168|nr:glucose 1-dehydrogenase 3 [Papilio machaon]
MSVYIETSRAMDFNNKVVIITGASSGIGAATAIAFAKQSGKVVLVGRNEEALNLNASKCEDAKGIKPLIIKAELTNDEDVKRVISTTIEKFGRIDVLVNNAGVGISGSIRDGIEPLDLAISTNVRPAYLLASLATPYLVQSKGNIINVSSIAAFKPIKDVEFLPYCMSKAAFDQFTRCLALELGKDGVRVNSVNPGATKTNFMAACGYNEDQIEEIFKIREQSVPLLKMVKSEEVADLILYLASDRASSITGSTFVIDNGEMLM